MSASKTDFYQGITLLLMEISKTYTNLLERVEAIEEKTSEVKKIKEEFSVISEQQQIVLKNLQTISLLQQDIVKHFVEQHKDIEALYLALGLKRELSYYSFNSNDETEH